MQSHFPSPFLMYSLSFTIITSVYSPAFYPYHPRFPISQAQLLSASARDTIVPADLLILNDACKLRLSIADFIYLLTNYYPWCLALCCIVCVHIKGAQCVCVCMSVSPQTAVIKYPGPCLFSQRYRSIFNPSLCAGCSPCGLHTSTDTFWFHFLFFNKNAENIYQYIRNMSHNAETHRTTPINDTKPPIWDSLRYISLRIWYSANVKR